MTTPAPFRLRQPPRFHNGCQGAALLVYLTARPEYPTRAALTTHGILHIHLQTLCTGTRLNRMLVAYLARHLTLPPETIEIAAGAQGAGKVVCFYSLSPAALEQRLRAWLATESLHTG